MPCSCSENPLRLFEKNKREIIKLILGGNMSANSFYRIGLRIAGSLLFLISLGYLLLPSHGYSPDLTTNWSLETKDHFYYLATYMICTFVLTLSILSLIYSVQRPSRPIAWFTSISTVLWSVRLYLETQFPVNVKLFFFEHPHNLHLIILGIIVASYAMASGVAWGMILIKR